MTRLWVICGAGSGVGKTHLAERLCAVLPDTVYAKQGCGTRQPGKPASFFQTAGELDAFLEAASQSRAHLVVESNELAREGRGDVIIFIDGAPGETDFRADAPLLRSKAHLHIGPDSRPETWRDLLQKTVDADLCASVCRVLEQQQAFWAGRARAVRAVEPLRISADGGPPVPDPGEVVVEELLTVEIDGVGQFGMMCTPCDIEALAAGFAFCEGLIASRDDIVRLHHRADERTVKMRIRDPKNADRQTNRIVTSSSGRCERQSIDAALADGPRIGDTLRVTPALLRSVIMAMHGRQHLFARTGGTHAAGVFTSEGELIAFGEDIGRHNALDKAVGQCLLRNRRMAGRGACLSGRVSVELVAKCALAGIELIAAVSAPSSAAVDAAERCHMTLCGFVRETRATVYTHRQRITAVAQGEA